MSNLSLAQNRNSIPDAYGSSLRPPEMRANVSGHHLRASADMSSHGSSQPSVRATRPVSELFYQPGTTQHLDAADKAADQWIAEIDQCETMLEEMASATTDQDFKAELTAIEEWFRVLSEAERTASLYALLQQATKVQILFFIQTLEEMLRKNPLPNTLAAHRVSDLARDSERSDITRSNLKGPIPSPNIKRQSGLDPSTIIAMFPDAAAAIAKKKAEYTQHTGNVAASNRNSLTIGDRSSIMTPSIMEPVEASSEHSNGASATPWLPRPIGDTLQTSTNQNLSHHSSRTSLPAGLRSPRTFQSPSEGIHTQSINVSENKNKLPILSPYNPGNASWASMSSTPLQAAFGTQQRNNQADMIANATAMKLAALSTVNNRIALDDVRKYQRRAKQKDNNGERLDQFSSTNGQNIQIMKDNGETYGKSDSSRLASGTQQTDGNVRPLSFSISHRSSYLMPADSTSIVTPSTNHHLESGANTYPSQESYFSDHSEIRAKSPRSARGSSRPPEDPTNAKLLQDIPSWLRSLRLHKYTDNLKNLHWQEMIELDEKGLEAKGVNALGARRKLLKAFEQVRDAKSKGDM